MRWSGRQRRVCFLSSHQNRPSARTGNAASRFSFGIEEEFFLSCPDTGRLTTRAAPDLLQTARRRLGDTVTCEMLESQIEIVSPIFHHAAEAGVVMSQLRRALAEAVHDSGSRLIAAGTHPLGVWHEQRVTNRPRYARLMSDFGIIGQRNLVCGLHVHVGVPEGVDRIDLMNRAIRWLPLFLALSTSSPFWNGRLTGLLSYRQALYDEWPRSGLPDFFDDEADYEAFIGRMQRAGAIRDASQLWWAIRPAARYPTLELRVTDACTRVSDSLAIASLFRCLVAELSRNPDLGARRTTHTRRIVDENRWRAKRDGIDAVFIAQASGDAVPAVEALRELLAVLDEQAHELECWRELQGLLRILEEGTSAHEQLRIYNAGRETGATHAASVGAVLEWLESETIA
jgi:carboxylate-amine ligase